MSEFMKRVRELGSLFMRTAKEGGEAAAEAIEQRAAIQRLAGNIRRLDRERNDLIRQIGSKVYKLHGKNKVRNDDVLVDCVRIDAIVDEIGQVQHQIEQIKLEMLTKDQNLVLEDIGELTIDDTEEPTHTNPLDEPVEGPSVMADSSGEPEYVPKALEPAAGGCDQPTPDDDDQTIGADAEEEKPQ